MEPNEIPSTAPYPPTVAANEYGTFVNVTPLTDTERVAPVDGEYGVKETVTRVFLKNSTLNQSDIPYLITKRLVGLLVEGKPWIPPVGYAVEFTVLMKIVPNVHPDPSITRFPGVPKLSASEAIVPDPSIPVETPVTGPSSPSSTD